MASMPHWVQLCDCLLNNCFPCQMFDWIFACSLKYFHWVIVCCGLMPSLGNCLFRIIFSLNHFPFSIFDRWLSCESCYYRVAEGSSLRYILPLCYMETRPESAWDLSLYLSQAVKRLCNSFLSLRFSLPVWNFGTECYAQSQRKRMFCFHGKNNMKNGES